MTDIQADIDKLKAFAGAITDLVGEMTSAGFVPGALTRGSPRLDIGQNDANFKDALDLYSSYEQARAQIIGDGQAPPGSFGDLVKELTLLSSVATQIYQNYQNANNEDEYSAAMVDNALNPPVSGSPASGG